MKELLYQLSYLAIFVVKYSVGNHLRSPTENLKSQLKLSVIYQPLSRQVVRRSPKPV